MEGINPEGGMPRIVLLMPMIIAYSGIVRAETPPVTQPWQFDVIQLQNGAVLKGLIVESNERLIRFQCVQRHPGRPTVSFPTTIYLGEVSRVEKLAPEQRVILQARVEQLERQTPQGEKERMEGLKLDDAPNGARRYASDFFTLTSTAPEEIVRRTALRLEQVYVAYSRFLPPRHQSTAPTAIYLTTDQAEYQKVLVASKQQFLNLAFFDPQDNRIVCYSDLQQMGERLVSVRQYHKKLRGELDAKRTEFAKLYRGKELQRMLAPITEARERLDLADAKNDELFAKATKQLFATLYHESFHAYMAGFVYPTKAGELPRWLNEGLAQIFETAILEGDELRVGHAEAARLSRAKDAATRMELVPIAELLRSGQKQFALSHLGERQVSDRHYLTSWALAFHLTFERRLLGTKAMDRFIKRVNEGADPKEAFEELIGTSIVKFEPEFRKYIVFLQANGNVLYPK